MYVTRHKPDYIYSHARVQVSGQVKYIYKKKKH